MLRNQLIRWIPSAPFAPTPFAGVIGADLRRPLWQGRQQGDSVVAAGTGAAGTGAAGTGFVPAVDLWDRGDALVLQADLPGLTRDQVEIVLENGVLTLRGERASEDREGAWRRERQRGRFSRSFALHHRVEADAVEATFRDGVLTVIVPKQPEAQPRQIAIQ